VETKVIQARSEADIAGAVSQACKVLSQGGLVAFPTETVYGLAGRADLPDSLDKLAELKERPSSKPFTLHIGQKSLVNRYIPELSPVNRQFLRKAWPGPLTVIFSLNEQQERLVREILSDELIAALYHNSTIGMRLPDNRVAQRLLDGVDGPVVAPSANLADEAPPTSADEVLEQLDGRIDLVLDGGPTRYARPSTIVRLNDDMEVIRAGVLDSETVGRMRSLTVLFVCTGNTCRSPMAQGLCGKQLAEKLGCSVDQLAAKGYKIISAGVAGRDGVGASSEAVEACGQMGVDIAGHRARRLTVDVVNQADFIFVMTRAHRKAVLELARQGADRVVLLAGQDEIEDPLGMGIEQYRECARLIERCLRQRLDETLWKGL